jgi:hypothetical protein
MHIHRQQRKMDIVRFRDGASRTVLIGRADLEVLEVTTVTGSISLGADFKNFHCLALPVEIVIFLKSLSPCPDKVIKD